MGTKAITDASFQADVIDDAHRLISHLVRRSPVAASL